MQDFRQFILVLLRTLKHLVQLVPAVLLLLRRVFWDSIKFPMFRLGLERSILIVGRAFALGLGVRYLLERQHQMAIQNLFGFEFTIPYIPGLALPWEAFFFFVLPLCTGLWVWGAATSRDENGDLRPTNVTLAYIFSALWILWVMWARWY